MSKTLKIISIVVGLLLLLVLRIGFSFWQTNKKANKAKALADSVIENLDSERVYSILPEKHFPKEQTQSLVGEIKQKCDWQNRDGKYVDFFSQKNIGGIDQTVFIYEYYLKCDSLRFLLSVNMENEPEIMGINLEPLETENPMILFPEKKLENR